VSVWTPQSVSVSAPAPAPASVTRGRLTISFKFACQNSSWAHSNASGLGAQTPEVSVPITSYSLEAALPGGRAWETERGRGRGRERERERERKRERERESERERERERGWLEATGVRPSGEWRYSARYRILGHERPRGVVTPYLPSVTCYRQSIKPETEERDSEREREREEEEERRINNPLSKYIHACIHTCMNTLLTYMYLMSIVLMYIFAWPQTTRMGASNENVRR
jgi:hypothetical protein